MTAQHVHFVGIGGTGMGSLAGLLKQRGWDVTGSDENLYPPMSDALARWEIPVAKGFAAEHVLARRPDLVVIGNVCRPDNPEARAAIDEGLARQSFSQALYSLAIHGKHSVVVSGTHGKTSTVAMLGTLLLETGRDPSILVGGIAENFDGSFREGDGDHFVVEGDEYDTAFFDKRPKFLHYGARTLVLTSLEFDHADIYRDLEHVKDAFRELVRGMPADGAIVAALGHAGVRDVVREAPCAVHGYGLEPGPGVDWLAGDVTSDEQGTRFRIAGPEQAEARFAQWGRHNVENATAAIVTAHVLGLPLAEAAGALTAFRGVRRRQEIRGEARGVTVLDDFAHHPTAVRETVDAMRMRFPGRRLVAVFEPRSNTSRRKVFQRDYVAALSGADRVIVSVVPDTPIYSATGEVTERFDAAQLAADLGDAAEAIDGVEAIVERLDALCEPGDVVLVMSNGAFGNIWQKLLDRLER